MVSTFPDDYNRSQVRRSGRLLLHKINTNLIFHPSIKTGWGFAREVRDYVMADGAVCRIKHLTSWQLVRRLLLGQRRPRSTDSSLARPSCRLRPLTHADKAWRRWAMPTTAARRAGTGPGAAGTGPGAQTATASCGRRTGVWAPSRCGLPCRPSPVSRAPARAPRTACTASTSADRCCCARSAAPPRCSPRTSSGTRADASTWRWDRSWWSRSAAKVRALAGWDHGTVTWSWVGGEGRLGGTTARSHGPG